MEKFVNIINTNFQKILQSRNDPNYHMFFDSFEWWNKMLNEWTNMDAIEKNIEEMNLDKSKISYDSSIDLSHIKPVEICTYIPNKTISAKKIKQLYNLIIDNNITDFNIIRKELETMFDYNMPSTLSEIQLDEYLGKIKKSTSITEINNINIIVCGAGPIGLFTALYLDDYYNRSYYDKSNKFPNIFNTYVNILLLDNRIYEEGIKLPYSRLTQFGFDTDEIQLFIKNIFCWKSISKERHFDFINTLENLLYLVAFERNIPMYFTKKYETFDKVKKLAKDNNFHYILDCTGGRLGANLEGNILWNSYKFTKGQYEVKYINNNMYAFYVNGEKYQHTTVVLQLLDENKRQFSIGNMFGFVTNNEDDELIKKYENKCFRIDDYIRISRKFKNNQLRYLLLTQIHLAQLNDKVKYVRITTFNTNSHHVNKVAQVIDNNLTYIGLGDTLGTSEYGIFFGLKHAILFSKYICNLFSTVQYLEK